MFSKLVFPTFTHFPPKTLLANVLAATAIKINSAPNLEIVRYKARKGTRAKALAKKRALKLRRQSQPPPIPKYLERKVKSVPELERRRCTDENWLESEPIDNVWNMKLYRGKPYSFAEAVRMHQETHAPAMLNDPSALIFANVELDLKLKKKDRYLENLNGIITFPKEFETMKKNRVIVVCKTPEDQDIATQAGADYVGSTSLIKQILSGSISKEDFDYVICHPDMYKELNTLRGILARKYPTTYNGLLRLDIEPAVKSVINGVEYSLKRSVLEFDFGWIDIPFGRLDMPVEHLEENFKLLLNTVEQQKPAGIQHLFILRSLLFCAKSREKFKVPHWEYLPNYPLNGIISEENEDDESVDDKKIIN